MVAVDYDVVLIENLTFEMFIGVYEHEKTAKQRVSVSVEATTLPNNAYKNDDIAQALSYEDMLNSIQKLVTKNHHYDLVESFAEDIAQALFLYPQIQSLKIVVKKPDIFTQAQSVGITIVRTRS